MFAMISGDYCYYPVLLPRLLIGCCYHIMGDRGSKTLAFTMTSGICPMVMVKMDILWLNFLSNCRFIIDRRKFEFRLWPWSN